MVKKNLTPPPFDPQKAIYLVDGSSFLYRAYYSLRPLHTTAGEPVQAVFSFCRMIKHLIDRFDPAYLGLIWDSKGKTTRHEIYEDYKATRQAAPSDLGDQKNHILNFAKLIGITNVAKVGVEADDLLYSIAKDLATGDNTVVLITSDKDLAQTLQDKVVIFDPFKDQIIDTAVFEEKMGFSVEKLSFYFALLGDSSDNIPGVRGIGKKGALDLAKQFDSLEDLYANIDKVKTERMRNALIAGKDNAFLSEKLFKLQYLNMGLKKEDFAFDENDWVNARPMFEELNLKSLLKGISGNDGASKQYEEEVPLHERLKQYSFKTIATNEDLDALCKELKKAGAFAIDTETDGLGALYNKLVGISVCYKKGESFYIPCAHSTGEPQLDCQTVIAKLKPILENSIIKKYLHNAKFDQLVLYRAGIEMAGVAFDSLIAARLILKEWQKAGLKPLSELYLDEPMVAFKEVLAAHKAKDFSQVPIDLATCYSGADAHQTYQLALLVQEKLAKEPKIQQLYQDIEFPLIQVLYAMEREGIKVDADQLQKLGKKVDAELKEVKQKIYDAAGATINLNSPKQVEDLLFNRLSLPPQKKRAKGAGYSTDHGVLTVLASMHPVPGLILKHRELAKLKNTYIDVLPTCIHPETGRIHTSYSQTSTATGRLASMNPNLQNIPTSSTYGMEIRQAFKPKEGHLFLSADYSQIELRVLAYLSQDKNLVQAFAGDHDIHAETAARLFGAPLDQVSHQQRQIGKRINFSILYGLTPYGLSKDMKIPLKDAKQYIESYFNQYPGVSRWMAEVIDDVMTTGYVDTLWGRRRHIPTIFEKNRMLHEEAKRLAINTKAQGTAAEIMKLGMLRIADEFARKKLDAAILLQIHDELLISVPTGQAQEIEMLVKNALEGVVGWNVPLKVTTRQGSSWKEVSK